MKIVSATYARNNFQDVINTAVYQQETVVVTKRDKPVVIITAFQDKLIQGKQKTVEPTIQLVGHPFNQEAVQILRQFSVIRFDNRQNLRGVAQQRN